MNRTWNSRRFPALKCGASAVALVMLWSSAAWGQTAVEELVVTARKREESIQDVPVSVTAFGGQELASRGVREVGDLLTTIPNVTPNNGLQIRGIGYNTRNIGIEAGATVYVDGVYTGRPDTFNQDLADIARVEVLRGPQGTLFGKNSIAGVISISTHDPVLQHEGEILGDYGNQGVRRLQIIDNEGLGDRAAFRVSYTSSKIGGFMRDLLNGQRFGGSEMDAFRGALLLKPADDLRILVRGDNLEQTSNPRTNETLLGDDPQSPPPRAIVAPGPFTTVEDSTTHDTLRLRGASVTAEYSGFKNLTLTSITGYRENVQTLAEGEDDSSLNVIEINWRNSQRQFSQEFRAAGTLGKLDYVAGGYYFFQKSFQENQGILGTDFAIPPLGIPGGVKKVIDPRGYIRTRSVAAYIDLTYKLTDALELEAGGRFGSEKKNFDFLVTSQAPALFYVVPRGTDAFTDTDFSPTLGARYHFDPDTMAYVRYAKGYKSGGWNADFVSATPGKPAPSIRSLRFEPENAATYEVGLKSQLFQHSLVIDIAAFYTDFSNLQVAQFFGINLEDANNQLAVTSNAGSATIKGVEIEGTWIPVEGLQLMGGLGYEDARYDRFENIDGKGGNANGKLMQGVPKWTGNASAIYTHPLANDARLILRADYAYISSRFGDPTNDPLRLNPSYWTANGRITYAAAGDKWQLSLWSRNITDELYVTAYERQQFAIVQSQPVRTVTYGRPRTYGVELRAKF